MVSNYKLLYHNFSSPSLQNTPYKIWGKMEINGKQQLWSVLLMQKGQLLQTKQTTTKAGREN